MKIDDFLRLKICNGECIYMYIGDYIISLEVQIRKKINVWFISKLFFKCCLIYVYFYEIELEL